MLIILFVSLTVFSGIRYGIGYDYYGYLKECMDTQYNYNVELIPRLMENVSNVTIPFVFFILSSCFISYFFYKGIELNEERYYYYSTVFYLGFPFFFMDYLGIIRQGMATAVVFYAIALYRQKIWWRLGLIILAYLCHKSALIAILIFFPWNKLSKSALWVLFFSGFVIGNILYPVIQQIIGLGLLSEYDAEKASSFLSEEMHNEGNLIKYLVFAICFIILSHYERLVSYSNDNRYFIGMIVFGTFLFFLLFSNISLAKRLGMFFYTPTIIIIPQLVRLLRLPRLIYELLCVSLLLISVYVGSSNRREEDTKSTSVTYPYRTIFDIIQ